jgi:hypothetical protein
VAETGADPSTPGCTKCPPQAVENSKFKGVLIEQGTARFSAGKGLAEMGNTLGYLENNTRASRAARRLQQKHLSKERERNVTRPKGAAAE